MFDMCYTDIMNETYRHSPTTVSLCNYHFVFCPRYRRKIFLLPGVEAFFKERIEEECRLRSIRILAMECHIDHVHLFVNTPPTYSPADIMKWLKGATSLALRKQFKELSAMPSTWTRSYFVSTAGNVSSETIKHYVDSQKTRS